MGKQRDGTTGQIRALRGARRAGDLVRLHRLLAGSDQVEGFVLAVGREWSMLALLDPAIRLDGFLAIRTGDVTSVKRLAGRHEFPVHLLAVRGQWPPAEPSFDVVLESPGTIIAGASDLFPLVRIFVEAVDPRATVIGRPVRCGARKLRLREMTRRGHWLPGTTTWPMAGVTRIEFGRRYDEALIEYAGLHQRGPTPR